jgi:hypothetical protein
MENQPRVLNSENEIAELKRIVAKTTEDIANINLSDSIKDEWKVKMSERLTKERDAAQAQLDRMGGESANDENAATAMRESQ